MRVLFTCHPALGHFLPLTSIALAMAEDGHDVAFGTNLALRGAVQSGGFRWIRASLEDDDPAMTAMWARWRELRGADRLKFFLQQNFGELRPRRMVPELLSLARDWRPDLLVRDAVEFGGMIASELLDIPHATVDVFAAGSRPRATAVLSEPLRQVRQEFGLPERPIADLMGQYLVLRPFPVSLHTVGTPVAPTAHHVRALPADDIGAVLPAWVERIGSRPLIYVSLGTLFSGTHGRQVFSQLLAGLRDLDAEVLVTVGQDFDPAVLGTQPSHIHLERFLPLGALLPRCSLVVFHGGSGTLIHAIASGLPMVILPLGADQPENAARCAELGISRTLDPEGLAPEHVSATVLDVLRTPSYRENAGRLRSEFERLPGPEFAVELLERLARDKTPIIASP